MNEVYIITMNWWQLALFVIAVALFGAFFHDILSRKMKEFLDKLEDKKK